MQPRGSRGQGRRGRQRGRGRRRAGREALTLAAVSVRVVAGRPTRGPRAMAPAPAPGSRARGNRPTRPSQPAANSWHRPALHRRHCVPSSAPASAPASASASAPTPCGIIRARAGRLEGISARRGGQAGCWAGETGPSGSRSSEGTLTAALGPAPRARSRTSLPHRIAHPPLRSGSAGLQQRARLVDRRRRVVGLPALGAAALDELYGDAARAVQR